MIYVFSYRNGEIEAEVEGAETEEEAFEALQTGNSVMFVSIDRLNPDMWVLAEVLEED